MPSECQKDGGILCLKARERIVSRTKIDAWTGLLTVPAQNVARPETGHSKREVVIL